MSLRTLSLRTLSTKVMSPNAWLLLAVGMLGTCFLVAPLAAQDDDGGPRGWGSRHHGPTGYWADDYSDEHELEGDETDCPDGFVFIDGKYVAPPYVVRRTEDAIYVNDQKVSDLVPVAPQQTRRGRSWQMREDNYSSSARYVADTLDQDGVVIAFPGQPLTTISDLGARYELLRQLSHLPGNAITGVSLVDQFSGGTEQAVVSQWMSNYQPTAEFRERAKEMLRKYEDSEAQALAEVSATHRLNQFSYPLSVFGMIMTVLATGHLLSHRPPITKTPRQTDASPETMQVVVWSLVLIALLSALDLAWTILAAQAGQMRELNPIGAHLIHDPTKLIYFKFAIIGGAVGLLYVLRRYTHAQAGAWWAVLICTLLTVRWLTFNSLFMA